MDKTLTVMTVAQVFAQCATPVVVLLGGIVGTQLAADPGLAALPIAFWILRPSDPPPPAKDRAGDATVTSSWPARPRRRR